MKTLSIAIGNDRVRSITIAKTVRSAGFGWKHIAGSHSALRTNFIALDRIRFAGSHSALLINPMALDRTRLASEF